MAQAQRLRLNGREPDVEQGMVNGFGLSWNPDDERFYVVRGEDTVATFREFRNAVRYARTHSAE